jgi:outer membrane protein assembly factor BamE (lipoprotein component of BamABCDE complex)
MPHPPRPTVALLAALLLGALTGCETPSSRIKRHPEMFARFPPEVQAKVREGVVELGYTKDMVMIALGAPDRHYIRRSDRGLTEIWSYVEVEYRTARQRVTGDFPVRDAQGNVRTLDNTVFVDVQHQVQYERMRVEFVQDQVSAIETIYGRSRP